jgi:hypothetical protein
MWTRVLAAFTSLLLFVLLPTAPAVARADTASASAVATAADFEAYFQAKNDWTWSGGDQVTSLRATNGLTYWSFGDTVIGKEDPVTGAYRPGWEFLPNTILVQRGDTWAATTYRNAVPDAADGDRYWTQGMFQAGGFLYVLCQRVRNTETYFQLRGAELAKFAIRADGTLAYRGMLPTPSTGLLDGNSPAAAQYSMDAVVDGGYVYVFGFSNEPGDVYAPHRSYVARVPVGSVETAAAWRFRDASGAWQPAMGLAAPILQAQISSVRLIGGRWVLAYKPWNGWGDTVHIETRAEPWGPALGATTISSPAGTTPGGRNYQTYSPQLHPEQALASGRLLVSIAWNGAGLSDIAADADLYKPRFHEVALP